MKTPRERRRSSSNENVSNSNPSDTSNDLDSLLANDDYDGISPLSEIFRKKTNNPFSTVSSHMSKAIEESELEEKARTDTNVIYRTGYSIHLLTPYVFICLLLAFGFILTDKYFFNIVEFLSQDIRYKLPTYGIMVLFFVILVYIFIKKSLDYINFEIFMTKYKISYGWKFLKNHSELTLFSIQEFLNKRGILGVFLNYGDLILYSTTRRKYSFDKIHGSQYIYEILQELRYGQSRGTLNQNATINNILSGGKSDDEDSEEEEKTSKSKEIDFNDLSSLGFTDEELKEFGMLPKKSSHKEDEEDDSLEPDTISVDSKKVVNDDFVKNTGRNSRVSERRQMRVNSNDRSPARGDSPKPRRRRA